MTDWKMRHEDITKLISHYRKHKCLWDFRSSEYKRADMKKDAWQELSNMFGREVDDVKRKMKYLRSAYVAEKKKVDDSYGSKVIYRPSLFYFDDMYFLDSIIVCRKTPRFERKYENSPDPIANYDEHPMESPSNDQYVTTEDARPRPPSPPSPSHFRYSESRHKLKMRHNRLAPYYSKLNEAVNTLAEVTKSTSEDSIYTAFGKTIALQLSQLPPVEATSTMSEIYQILSKNIIQSMLSRSGGLSSKNVNQPVVQHHPDRKISMLEVTVDNGTDEDDDPIEFDEVSI